MATDPRIYFAAERTLLAWVCTGIAVMGFGFIVGRFGDFLAVASDDPQDAGLSSHAVRRGGTHRAWGRGDCRRSTGVSTLRAGAASG